MQCYVGGRRSGKTRHLINLSHETGITIVTRTNDMAKQIEYDAMRIGKPIPRPICIANRARLIGTLNGRNVLVDEAGGILEDILCVHIVAASIDGEALKLANPALANLESMGLFELLRTWRKERKANRKEEQCKEEN